MLCLVHMCPVHSICELVQGGGASWFFCRPVSKSLSFPFTADSSRLCNVFVPLPQGTNLKYRLASTPHSMSQQPAGKTDSRLPKHMHTNLAGTTENLITSRLKPGSRPESTRRGQASEAVQWPPDLPQVMGAARPNAARTKPSPVSKFLEADPAPAAAAAPAAERAQGAC